MIRETIGTALVLFSMSPMIAEEALAKGRVEAGFNPVARMEPVGPAVHKSFATKQAIPILGAEFVSSGKSDALSIAIVRNGEAHFYNFGSVSPERKVLPSEHSLFEIGSITKVFTALLLAHAVVEGRIGLHDDVRQYLPGNYPNLAFEGTPVRIIDLADFTSALPDNLPDLAKVTASAKPGTESSMIAHAWAQYSEASLLEDLKSVNLVGRPGVIPRHSNIAAELLGVILKRAYGASYEALLTQYIDKPLHMKSGTGNKRSALFVTGYDMQHHAMPAISGDFILPAGGLRYSSADLANFVKAELAASDRALRLTQEPAWGNPENAAVGLGWRISKTSEGKAELYTSGGTFGSSSYIEMVPSLGYGIVLLANRAGETEGQLHDLADQLLITVAKDSNDK